MDEFAAGEGVSRPCLTCGKVCDINSEKRTVTSLDGPVEIMELKGHCPACRRTR